MFDDDNTSLKVLRTQAEFDLGQSGIYSVDLELSVHKTGKKQCQISRFSLGQDLTTWKETGNDGK